jgi:superfamily II DNA or RNA helicase
MTTKFFTNQGDNTLYKKFEGIFKYTKVNDFDALVGYLRASGYFKIRKFLKKVPKIRILVGINVDQAIKHYHQIGLEFATNEQKILEELNKDLKSDIQNSPYNKETEEGILEFIKDISSKKIEIAAHPSKNIHAKIYIFKPKPFNKHNSGSVITGSSNLSATGIGALPESNYEFNVELRDYDDVNYASKEFEKLWNESIEILPAEVVKENIKKLINETYLSDSITPYELYYKMLIEYFGSSVDFDPSSINDLPPNYKKLDYQADAVNEGFSLLQKHRGFFLSDVVGTGKTIIATLIAKKLFNYDLHKYEGKINKTLIIAPQTIRDDWEKVLKDFGLPNYLFLPNRSFHWLYEKPAYDPRSFDLIIVDEAHKFRSNTADSYNELQKLCKTPTNFKLDDGSILEKKIILISASPLNNSPEDIKNQILLFQDGKNSTLEISNIDYFFNQKIKQYKALSKEQDKQVIKEQVKDIYGSIREKIISQIMIRRTRTDLMNIEQYKKNLDDQKIIFPKVGKPNKVFYILEENLEELYDKTFIIISKLNYVIYDEIKNLNPEARKKYEIPEVAYSALADIMKTLLVKRLDSSFEAFKQSLYNFLIKLKSKIKQFENKKIFILPGLKSIDISEYVLEDREEELEKILLNDESKGDIYKPEDFDKDFLKKLKQDYELIEPLYDQWKDVKEDPKYEILINNLKNNLFKKPLNTGGKVVIFSEAKVTTDYLLNRLKKDGFEKILNIDATNRHKLKSKLQTEFDENFDGEKENNYNILITTEVLAEGINLHRSNIIINYDTPWNSTRLIQRIGRVNRIGSKADKIHVYNFFPTSNVEGDIKLEQKAFLKLQSFHEALGEDSQIYHEAEETKTFGIFDKDIEEEQNEKLSFLMDLREFKKNNEIYYRKILNMSKRQRVGRKNSLLKNSTISFIRSEKRNGFYLVDEKKNVHPKTFVETIKIFKAKKDEKAIHLHKNHHLQVDIALKEFEREQYEKISENKGVNTTLGPQSKQALAFLDLCSRADFLNLVEKEKILMAKKCIRDSRFIELQREINRHKNLSKKTKLKITQTIDGLLRILKKFPLEDINNTQKINDETIPEIIISESYN